MKAMMVIEANRNDLFSILAPIFSHNKIKPKAAEVGVLRGKNAKDILAKLEPSHLFLIDSWSVESSHKFQNLNSHRDWVSDLDKFEFYYGGALDRQETYDAIYAEALREFDGNANVTIIRKTSLGGFRHLLEQGETEFDFIYVDASHDYESALDDLMCYSQLLKKDFGIFQLNDCCHSVAGVQQNLGVLEAANKFCKIKNFVPVVAVNRDFTDVILAPKRSPLVTAIKHLIEQNNIISVEVPDELFANMTVKSGARPSISFTSG